MSSTQKQLSRYLYENLVTKQLVIHSFHCNDIGFSYIIGLVDDKDFPCGFSLENIQKII